MAVSLILKFTTTEPQESRNLLRKLQQRAHETEISTIKNLACSSWSVTTPIQSWILHYDRNLQ